jgi:hypothetical protein
LRASSRSFKRCAAELGTGRTAPDVFSTVADLLLEEDLPLEDVLPNEETVFIDAGFDCACIEDALVDLEDFPGEAMDFFDGLICLGLLLDFMIPPKGFVLNGSSKFTAKGSLISFQLVKE